MNNLPPCQKCNSSYTYADENKYICPECGYEWTEKVTPQNIEQTLVAQDAFGNTLNNGDTVTVIKDLKLKGSSLIVKVGTKVKNIRIVDSDHNIDCKIEGIGAMKLKSEFVKKA